MSDTDLSAEQSPLLRGDPPMLGSVLLQGRLASTDSGVVYAGRLVDESVLVVLLTEGAERDSYARARFLAAATTVVGGEATGDSSVESDHEVSPWVVLPAGAGDTALRQAVGLLAAVNLADRPSVGEPTGPDFRPHWYQRVGVGRWRLWPLPWPTRLSTASRWTFLASFATVLLIAALALFIASRLFSQSPTVEPPRLPQPTFPSSQTPPTSGSPSSTVGPPTVSGGGPGSTPPFV